MFRVGSIVGLGNILIYLSQLDAGVVIIFSLKIRDEHKRDDPPRTP